MTAEIGILNREAVALAADSAVTSGEKIFSSANKIFTLSKHWPAGAMVYGSAHFMSTPWETVVKLYRSQLGERSFPTLAAYAEDLLAFLCREPRFSPESAQRSYVLQNVEQEFVKIRREVDETVQALIQAETEITEELVKKFPPPS